jgi:predicted acylesterase/phospholipase RssA
MLEAVKASCTIPPSFHPADIILQSQQNSYPDSEGILLSDGNYHVDGGIAAPAPPTPRDGREGACPIIISPISAGAPFFFPRERETMRISPVDDSWRLLPISNLICRGDFDVKPSIQNLRALRMASGLVSSKELEGWFQLGIDDALRVVKIWK